jgi:restriction endonuclease S subunit
VSNATHDGSFVLIGRQGALCGNVKRTSGAFFATEHAVVCSPHIKVDINWAFHFMDKMNLNQYATKSAQPGLAVGNLERISIPFPPFEVQQAIARVLDLFQSLEAELEARRRQYAHYRDALLSFDNTTGSAGVRWLTLSEIAKDFGRGKSKHRPRNAAHLLRRHVPLHSDGRRSKLRAHRHQVLADLQRGRACAEQALAERYDLHHNRGEHCRDGHSRF